MGCNREPTKQEVQQIHIAATRVAAEVGADPRRARTYLRLYDEQVAKMRLWVDKVRGSKIDLKATLLNIELKGRVDEKGNIYSGTSWLSEKKIGRVAEDGTIFRGTHWLNEVVVGRIDSKGNIHKGASWLTEKKVGRIDKKGNVHQGTTWLTEKQIGHIG